MTQLFKRRPRTYAAAFVVLGVLFAGQDLNARGVGLSWGYRPPSGYALFKLWTFSNPWCALNGMSIPHHSHDARGGYGRSGSSGYSGSSGNLQFPTLDRSVAFPGSSSDTASLIPSFKVPTPTKPYKTDKQFDPPYYNHYDSYWLNGYWGGGKWGWARWGGPTGIWSVARWSFGPIYYSSGYGLYTNPFVAGLPAAINPALDYSNPIEDVPDDDEPAVNTSAPTSTEQSGTPPSDEGLQELESYVLKSPEVRAGLKSFDAASEAFKKKDYDQALKLADEALNQLPIDAAVHQFRALVLFALGDYQQSAAAVYAVLAVSPGWDWTTMIGLYGDQEEYSRHLRALEAAHKKTPDSAAMAFLRGYHYATCRHFDAAVKQFQNVVKLLPDDDLVGVVTSLIAGASELSPQVASAKASTPASRPPTDKSHDAAATPITPAKLIGEWKAFRGGKVSIQLKLREDRQFVWVATQAGEARRFAGTYAIDGNMLFLEGRNGGLVGRIQMRGPGGGFNFKLIDNAPADAGLDFAK